MYINPCVTADAPYIARVAQWWSIALPRRGSRVRIPSRALLQESNDSCFFCVFSSSVQKRKSVIRFRITLRRQVNHIGLYSPTQAANRIQGTCLVPATLSVLYTNNVTELVSYSLKECYSLLRKYYRESPDKLGVSFSYIQYPVHIYKRAKRPCKRLQRVVTLQSPGSWKPCHGTRHRGAGEVIFNQTLLLLQLLPGDFKLPFRRLDVDFVRPFRGKCQDVDTVVLVWNIKLFNKFLIYFVYLIIFVW